MREGRECVTRLLDLMRNYCDHNGPPSLGGGTALAFLVAKALRAHAKNPNSTHCGKRSPLRLQRPAHSRPAVNTGPCVYVNGSHDTDSDLNVSPIRKRSPEVRVRVALSCDRITGL